MPILLERRRAGLLALLERHRPADDAERRDLERMRAYARTLADPFSRHEPEAHFTASAILTDPAGERTCLVHHRKLGRWLQPGGHMEPVDEGDAARAALREAREETGCAVDPAPARPGLLDVDIHPIPARADQPEHLHLDLRFLLVARTPDDLAHDPAEALGARWVAWDDALELVDDPALRRALNKARTRREP